MPLNERADVTLTYANIVETPPLPLDICTNTPGPWISMAINHSHTRFTSLKHGRCKSCSRVLATTAADGDLLPAGTQDQACDTCRRFEELHDDLKKKDEVFESLTNRRFEHAGRQQALEEAKAAHKAFDNFLIHIEAQPTSDIPQQQEQKADGENSQDQEKRDGQTKQDQKRTRTLSASPHSHKRPRFVKTDSRRVSFDSSVIFREEHENRPEQAFNRGSEIYVPGRNAPPDAIRYLDTSGYGTTATRFFGVKKNKKGWIQTKEGKEMDEQWRSVGEGGQEEENRDWAAEDDKKQNGGALGVEEGYTSRDTVQEKLADEITESESFLAVLCASATGNGGKNINEEAKVHACEEDTDGKQQVQSTREDFSTQNTGARVEDAVSSTPHLQPPPNPSLVEDNHMMPIYGDVWAQKTPLSARPKGIGWKLETKETL